MWSAISRSSCSTRPGPRPGPRAVGRRAARLCWRGSWRANRTCWSSTSRPTTSTSRRSTCCRTCWATIRHRAAGQPRPRLHRPDRDHDVALDGQGGATVYAGGWTDMQAQRPASPTRRRKIPRQGRAPEKARGQGVRAKRHRLARATAPEPGLSYHRASPPRRAARPRSPGSRPRSRNCRSFCPTPTSTPARRRNLPRRPRR
jgi:hypothetical protein